MSLTHKIIVLILFAVLLISSLWFFNLRIFLADYYYQKVSSTQDWPKILDYYQKIFTYQPFEPFYRQKFALDLKWGLQFYKNEENKVKILDLAINQIEKIPSRDRSFYDKFYLAKLQTQKTNLTQEEQDFIKAEEFFKDVSQMAPSLARVYVEWCQLKIYKKEWEEAREMCRRAFSLYPPLNYPQINEEHRQKIKAEMTEVYEKAGEIYTALKDYSKAEAMYLQILKFFPLAKPNIWKKIGDIYYLQGDIDKAIDKNFHGYTLRPNDPFWSLALALLYDQKGDKEKALIWAENVLKLDPENKDAQFLLNKLGTVPRTSTRRTRTNSYF